MVQERDQLRLERPRRQRAARKRHKQVIKQGLSEYFLFTIEGREDIEDKQPKRLVALKVADVPLECFYKLSDRDGGQAFTKFYRFKNVKLLDDNGKEKKLSGMENLGPLAAAGRHRAALLRVQDARTWPTSAARPPSTCPSATASRSTSAATRTSRSSGG